MPSLRREAWIGFAALLAVRTAMLAALGALTGGAEFADDPKWQRLYVDDPWLILLGHRLDHEYDRFIHVYPPLLPWFLAAPGMLLRLSVSDFYLLRSVYVLYELAAWPFLFHLIASRTSTARARRVLTAVYVLLPVSWMSSVVMSQEEVIAFFWMTVTFALLVRGRRLAAIATCSLGVVSAKIFFLVPLAALVLGTSRGSWKSAGLRIAVAAAPLAIGYAVPAAVWTMSGSGFPLGGFTAKVEDSTSLWSLFPFWEPDVFVGTLKKASMLAALCAGLTPLLFTRLRRETDEPERIARLMVAMLLWVFVAFYQIQPEYWLMLVPGFAVVLRPVTATVVNAGLLSVAWSINVFYGIRVALASGATGGKALFTRWWEAWIPFEPSTLQQIAVVGFAFGTIALAVRLTRARTEPESRAALGEA